MTPASGDTVGTSSRLLDGAEEFGPMESRIASLSDADAEILSEFFDENGNPRRLSISTKSEQAESLEIRQFLARPCWHSPDNLDEAPIEINPALLEVPLLAKLRARLAASVKHGP